MKFSKPKKQKAIGEVATVAGAAVGGMASNYALSAIIGDGTVPTEIANDPEKVKAHNKGYLTKKKIAKGAAAVAGLTLAAFVEGNDEAAQALKGIGYGTAVMQGISLVKEFVDVDKKENETMKKALEGLKGGACTSCLRGEAPSWITNYDIYPSRTYQYDDEPIHNYTSIGQTQGTRTQALMSYKTPANI